MKKLVLLFILSACVSDSVPDLDVQNYKWETVESLSKGSIVTMYMWGGSEILNQYMTGVIAPVLKKRNDITLEIVPVTDIKDTINKIIVEKQANRNRGSVDVLWLNGENFKLIKDVKGLWGAFAGRLPVMKYINSMTMKTDFGTPIENLEVPWGEAQFNFIYNGEGPVPFTDAKSLLEYVMNNPGRFTYPAIPDFIGSAFVRNIAIDIIGYDNIVKMNDEEFQQSLAQVWQFFNKIKPYLWKKGQNYPENFGKLDLLFQNDNIDITMSYTISQVTTSIARGDYPKNSKSFLLDDGTLFNNHYLSIPWNAPNKAGALYLINYLLEKDTQIQRLDDSVLGWSSVLDLKKISAEDRVQIEQNSQGVGMVSSQEMINKRVFELTPKQLEIIEKGWLTYVVGFDK